DALKHIKTRSGKVQTIYVVYVVNNDNELIGVLSLRNIINSDPAQRISDVMNSDVIKIESFIDQEEIAHVMRKYDFLAIPV
ncbi:CBS domain-containing protein, partial [Staphylococcus aureus]|nr:CBS domain-containing protein [Staphylococcus aureus]